VGSFPFKASGRARASGDTDGFVKVLADQTTDEILGVHMIGPRITDLIAEAVTAMEFRSSAEDVARMSHSHPTYAEAMKEACLAATENRAIHMQWLPRCGSNAKETEAPRASVSFAFVI
jgi:dihydrolipoamide dehydrogenase